ncbi:MAG: BrnT family toxin [Alphaproteobacteria bacterium]|nr:BrnT family toxin [Alphaproteobacteria bacterium]
MFIWDDTKNASNKAKHRLSFEAAYDFEWATDIIIDRSRHNDGEKRYAAVGMLYGKLHTVIFTMRGDDIRIICLRRSNTKEEKTYAENH